MKLGETSLLELICTPLKYFPWVSKTYEGRMMSHDLFEHVFTGPILFAIFSVFHVEVLLIPMAFIHIVVKEIFYDMFIKKLPFNKTDVTTRSYGWGITLILALISVLL